MDTKTFYITEKAGIFVAGARNPGVDEPIELTEAQAEHYLREELITRTKPKSVKDAEKAEKAAADEAAEFETKRKK